MELKEASSELMSGAPTSDAVLNSPFYRDVIEAVFPNHAHGWYRFESVAQCLDRSKDIARFKVRSAYQLDLASAVPMVLRPGQSIDTLERDAQFEVLRRTVHECAAAGWSREGIAASINAQLPTAETPITRTLESRLTEHVLELGAAGGSSEEIQKLLLLHHFYHQDGMAEYVRGTRDRALASKAPDYNHLLSLHELFTDGLKDSCSLLLQRALEDDLIRGSLPNYAARLESTARAERAERTLATVDLSKIGVTPGLLDQLQRIANTTSGETRRNALGRVVAREQQRVARIVDDLTGQRTSADDIHLADVSFSWLRQRALAPSPGPLPDQLLERRIEGFFQGVYSHQVALIRAEIAKYGPEAGTIGRPVKLDAVITKSKASAHARGTAGVCVSQDNPTITKGRESASIWTDPDYLQLVIFDRSRGRSEGLVLLHHYEDQGRKILTASFNPTSSLLYRVDQKGLFEATMGALIQFAEDNGIDEICSSVGKAIRTNRTGGQFEAALDERIRAQNRKRTLSIRRFFSYSPRYAQQELDVLWSKPGVSGS
jgi:hypothetical protein